MNCLRIAGIEGAITKHAWSIAVHPAKFIDSGGAFGDSRAHAERPRCQGLGTACLRLDPEEAWGDRDSHYRSDESIEQARALLIEFVGGEPGEQLRNHFTARGDNHGA
jgi:hypothetical protein